MLKWKKGGKEKKLLAPVDSFVVLVHRWQKGYLEEEREKIELHMFVWTLVVNNDKMSFE